MPAFKIASSSSFVNFSCVYPLVELLFSIASKTVLIISCLSCFYLPDAIGLLRMGYSVADTLVISQLLLDVSRRKANLLSLSQRDSLPLILHEKSEIYHFVSCSYFMFLMKLWVIFVLLLRDFLVATLHSVFFLHLTVHFNPTRFTQ